jgi:hypothetical protein
MWANASLSLRARLVVVADGGHGCINCPLSVSFLDDELWTVCVIG